jgi:hypothetical protein
MPGHDDPACSTDNGVTDELNVVVDEMADAPDDWSRQAADAAIRRIEW